MYLLILFLWASSAVFFLCSISPYFSWNIIIIIIITVAAFALILQYPVVHLREKFVLLLTAKHPNTVL